MDGAAPSLPADKGLSDDLASFLALCLDKEPTRRPPAKDLLKHPWIRTASSDPRPLPDAPPPAARRSASRGSSAGGDGRHDDELSPLERSRSNLDMATVRDALGEIGTR